MSSRTLDSHGHGILARTCDPGHHYATVSTALAPQVHRTVCLQTPATPDELIHACPVHHHRIHYNTGH
jgi:hypothetical protein